MSYKFGGIEEVRSDIPVDVPETRHTNRRIPIAPPPDPQSIKQRGAWPNRAGGGRRPPDGAAREVATGGFYGLGQLTRERAAPTPQSQEERKSQPQAQTVPSASPLTPTDALSDAVNGKNPIKRLDDDLAGLIAKLPGAIEAIDAIKIVPPYYPGFKNDLKKRPFSAFVNLLRPFENIATDTVRNALSIGGISTIRIGLLPGQTPMTVEMNLTIPGGITHPTARESVLRLKVVQNFVILCFTRPDLLARGLAKALFDEAGRGAAQARNVAAGITTMFQQFASKGFSLGGVSPPEAAFITEFAKEVKRLFPNLQYFQELAARAQEAADVVKFLQDYLYFINRHIGVFVPGYSVNIAGLMTIGFPFNYWAAAARIDRDGGDGGVKWEMDNFRNNVLRPIRERGDAQGWNGPVFNRALKAITDVIWEDLDAIRDNVVSDLVGKRKNGATIKTTDINKWLPRRCMQSYTNNPQYAHPSRLLSQPDSVAGRAMLEILRQNNALSKTTDTLTRAFNDAKNGTPGVPGFAGSFPFSMPNVAIPTINGLAGILAGILDSTSTQLKIGQTGVGEGAAGTAAGTTAAGTGAATGAGGSAATGAVISPGMVMAIASIVMALIPVAMKFAGVGASPEEAQQAAREAAAAADRAKAAANAAATAQQTASATSNPTAASAAATTAKSKSDEAKQAVEAADTAASKAQEIAEKAAQQALAMQVASVGAEAGAAYAGSQSGSSGGSSAGTTVKGYRIGERFRVGGDYRMGQAGGGGGGGGAAAAQAAAQAAKRSADEARSAASVAVQAATATASIATQTAQQAQAKADEDARAAAAAADKAAADKAAADKAAADKAAADAADAAGKKNTAMLVGGVAALALVGLVLAKKK